MLPVIRIYKPGSPIFQGAFDVTNLHRQAIGLAPFDPEDSSEGMEWDELIEMVREAAEKHEANDRIRHWQRQPQERDTLARSVRSNSCQV